MYKRCYISNLLVNASESFLISLWLNYVDVQTVKGQLVQRKFTVQNNSKWLYKIMVGQLGQPQYSFGWPRATGKAEPWSLYRRQSKIN